MDVRDKESWLPKNWCFRTVVLEKTLEDPWDCKEIQPVHPKGNQSWMFIGRTDPEAETPTLWPPDAKNWPWCWERLKAGGKGDDRGWDGWMASPTQQTWVWVSSGSWWWTGKPCMLQSMGSQRVRHDWATELNWSEIWHNYLHVELGKAKLHSSDSNWELISEERLEPIASQLCPYLGLLRYAITGFLTITANFFLILYTTYK